MITTIHELLTFSEWADAEHYRALAQCPDATVDPIVHERLHHYHLTQHAFLWVLSHGEFSRTQASDFENIAALKQYAMLFHQRIRDCVGSLSDQDMQETVTIPWLKNAPMQFTKEQALLQVVLHTHGHRAQNASRLRALGGEPPTTDWIMWLWKGKPVPAWD